MTEGNMELRKLRIHAKLTEAPWTTSDKQRALQRLDKLPRTHNRAVPGTGDESIDLDEIFKQKPVHLMVSIPKRAPYLDTMIKVDLLAPGQDTVFAEGVQRYIEEPPQVSTPKYIPNVVAYKGRFFIESGHTRITTQILRGRHEVLVRLYAVDDSGHFVVPEPFI